MLKQNISPNYNRRTSKLILRPGTSKLLTLSDKVFPRTLFHFAIKFFSKRQSSYHSITVMLQRKPFFIRDERCELKIIKINLKLYFKTLATLRLQVIRLDDFIRIKFYFLKVCRRQLTRFLARNWFLFEEVWMKNPFKGKPSIKH